MDERDGRVIVAIGSDDDGAVVEKAIRTARDQGRDLVIVDRGGEGLLGNAYYDDMRADDDLKPSPEATFDASIARREGRNDLSRYLDDATAAGVTAGGWFPPAAGIEGLRTAIAQFDGAVLVVPDSVRRPSLGDRFRGVTLDQLEQLGVELIVAG